MLRRIFPDLLAFGIGLGVAYFLKWETRDLVWSLWLGSLVLGYLTLLSAIGGAGYYGLYMTRQQGFKAEHRKPAMLAGIAGGLFFLVFFSLHFCGFHAGHSVFLNQFFPLEGLPKEGFGEAFMNPLLLWLLVFRHLMKPYGIFLLPAIIAERKYVFAPLIKAVRAVRSGDAGFSLEDFARGKQGKRGKSQKLMADTMGRPYINVVRMHLLIFFFAFCHFLKLDSFLVFAVVYFVYFFPWNEFRQLKGSVSVPEVAS